MERIAIPHVYLDATHLHVRFTDAQVVPMAVRRRDRDRADGSREVLGLEAGDSEDETFWRALLLSLKQRSLHGGQLLISEQHSGLVKARGVTLGFCTIGTHIIWDIALVDADHHRREIDHNPRG